MKSLWDNGEASTFQGELGQCVYAARLLGKERALVAYPGGSASVKTRARDLFGEEEEILLVSASGQDLGRIAESDFTSLHRNDLVKLLSLDALPDDRLENALLCSRTVASPPLPPVESLVHALLPHRFVSFAHPDALLAIANTVNALDRLHQIYAEAVLVVGYARSGFPLAKACADALRAFSGKQLDGIIAIGQGLFTFGDKARTAYERMIDLASRAEQYLKDRRAWELNPPPLSVSEKPLRRELSALRKAISDVAGLPLILSTHSDALSLEFFQRADIANIFQAGPAFPAQAAVTKPLPLVGQDVPAYRAAYERYFHEHAGERDIEMHDPAPRVVLDPQLGLCAAGRTAGEAALAADLCLRNIQAILRATALGGYRPLPAKDAFEAEYSQWNQPQRQLRDQSMFAGEIALVTGGASGIGKACVESLLARGAAVASLDINPAVTTMYRRPDYLGLQCDLTDEAAVIRAFEAMARTFGGLDMLVLNAGIFPAGVRIESLQLSEWARVMGINLDPNVVVMREAYPLLKCSPRGGRVVVNASKNVLAPGAGAAAYSVSKAAVTQLARVAALEWGKDRIRVNIIHPDGIFDTGIWTEEVLKARAAYYGLTVEQYKTRNLLGVELNSRDVGELVAEMLGPLFGKITGAQIPVDGGSDRVI